MTFSQILKTWWNNWKRRKKSPTMLWGMPGKNGIYLKRFRMSDSVVLIEKENIRFSDNIHIGHYCILDGSGGLEIGKGSQLSSRVSLFTHSSHMAIRLYGEMYTQIEKIPDDIYFAKPIRIGKYCFIGAGSYVLPGVKIGDYSAVAAGTLVKKSIPAYSFVAGNPAEIKGDVRKMDKRYLEKYPELKQSYIISMENADQ